MNMDCKRIWDLDVLISVMGFTKTFINNELANNRAQRTFNTEMSLLPATQPLVERTLQREKVELEIAALRKKKEEAQKRVNIEVAALMDALYKKKAELQQAVRNVDTEIGQAYEKIHELSIYNNTDITKERRSFIMKCPVTESPSDKTQSCKGFLSTQYVCGICESSICPKCHVIKRIGPKIKDQVEPPHTCNEDDIKTIEVIKKESKACPKCGEMIQRTEGCSQMWCTMCHTPFDWNTQAILSGPIHNPHAIEYRRRMGITLRAVGDVACGGIPGIEEVTRIIKAFYVHNRSNGVHIYEEDISSINFRIYIDSLRIGGFIPEGRYGYHPIEMSMDPYEDILDPPEDSDVFILYGFMPKIGVIPQIPPNQVIIKYGDLYSVYYDGIEKVIASMIQQASHIQHVEIMRYRADIANDNVEMRINYMLNRITKEQFQARLKQDAKKHNKNRYIHQILDTYVTGFGDIVREFVYLNHHLQTYPLVYRPDCKYNNQHSRYTMYIDHTKSYEKGNHLTPGSMSPLDLITHILEWNKYIIGELDKISRIFNCTVPTRGLITEW